MATAFVKFPKKFTLGAIDWAIEEKDILPNALGACSNQDAKIVLLKSLAPQSKEQTLCHELVHAILFSMGKPVDQHDEVFVDGFATFLHQVLTTLK